MDHPLQNGGEYAENHTLELIYGPRPRRHTVYSSVFSSACVYFQYRTNFLPLLVLTNTSSNTCHPPLENNGLICKLLQCFEDFYINITHLCKPVNFLRMKPARLFWYYEANTEKIMINWHVLGIPIPVPLAWAHIYHICWHFCGDNIWQKPKKPCHLKFQCVCCIHVFFF